MTASSAVTASSGTAPISVAVLDMAGTTVVDDGTVEAAFLTAIAEVGGPAESPDRPAMLNFVRATMGQSKIDVFTHLLKGDRDLAATANAAFEKAYAGDLSSCRPVPGAVEAFDTLRAGGVRVALTTGFSPATQDAIIAELGWRDRIDLALAPGDGIRGRPYPDLALVALLRLGADDVRALAVVGDTASDVTSGIRAGAGLVAGVLTGAHDRSTLLAAGAHRVLASVAELPALLLE